MESLLQALAIKNDERSGPYKKHNSRVYYVILYRERKMVLLLGKMIL